MRTKQPGERATIASSPADVGSGTQAHQLAAPLRRWRWFRPGSSCRRQGVQVEAAGLPRITIHGIRHNYLMMLLRGRVRLRVVSQGAGHASPTVSMTIYNHAMPGDDQAVAAATGRLLAGS